MYGIVFVETAKQINIKYSQKCCLWKANSIGKNCILTVISTFVTELVILQSTGSANIGTLREEMQKKGN
jgi:hypothetical protein